MRIDRGIAVVMIVLSLSAALSASGCAPVAMPTSGGAGQVPVPTAPADKARDAVGGANNAIGDIQDGVDQNTPGK